jgi:hypothetical protein
MLRLRRATDPVRDFGWPCGKIKKNLFAPPKAVRLPAVCIPPGARLLLQDISLRLQYELEVGPVEEVVFTELTRSCTGPGEGGP